jgi:hypothetical protein
VKIKSAKAILLGAALVVAGLVGGVLPASGGPSAIYKNPVEPEMTPKLNLGKLNYGFYCAACHGQTAGGSDKGPTFISRIYHPGHHGDQSFFVAPRRGVRAHHWPFGDMAPVPGVTDKQISLIIGYVRAVQKANGLF